MFHNTYLRLLYGDNMFVKLIVFICTVTAMIGMATMTNPVVISIYQGTCVEGEFSTNLATVREVIEEAKKRKSDFVAFPETFLSGYECGEAVESGARTLDDPELQKFIKESADHDMVVLVGLARRTDGKIYNTELVIYKGEILGMYDKVMLTPGDHHTLGFEYGKQVPVFEVHGIRFAVNICADTSYIFPAMSAKMQGAQLLFTPHNNEIPDFAADDHRHWVRNCHVGLACHLQMAVARPNIVKSDRPKKIGYGDSFILSPQGTPLVEAKLFNDELITATLTPEMFGHLWVWSSLYDTPAWLRQQIADQLTDFRMPKDDADTRRWLENMSVYHGYSIDEISKATGIPANDVGRLLHEYGLANAQPVERQNDDPICVLPYPGGRHPRAGFFEAAVLPQRDTKISIFTPWADGGYVVVDLPEVIFSSIGTLYLAHRDPNVKTIWDEKEIKLERMEWHCNEDGTYEYERVLPNNIAFGARVVPGTHEVKMSLWLCNDTDETLSGLKVQNCVMLAAARGFEEKANKNKKEVPPAVAVGNNDGTKWIVTAWSDCENVWENPRVPCMHSDPCFPDCTPGETVGVNGILSFYEGKEIEKEMQRLSKECGE